MKPEEIYDAWKKQKSKIQISPGFSERVMNSKEAQGYSAENFLLPLSRTDLQSQR
jgi:hypothetical protein